MRPHKKQTKSDRADLKGFLKIVLKAQQNWRKKSSDNGFIKEIIKVEEKALRHYITKTKSDRMDLNGFLRSLFKAEQTRRKNFSDNGLITKVKRVLGR